MAVLSAANQLSLTWQDNADDETDYVLAISLTEGFENSDLQGFAADTELAVVDNLTPETPYYFRLRALNEAGASAWTDPQSLSTLGLPMGGFVISGGIWGLSADQVSLDSSMVFVDELRYKLGEGDFGDWQAYSDSLNLDVSAQPDGELWVYMQYRNSVGDLLRRSDSILLDRTPPQINRFVINDDAVFTSSRAVTLQCNVEGATQMQLQDDHSIYPNDWQDFSPELAFNLSDFVGQRHITAWFRDAYGNVSDQIQDIILYQPGNQEVTINSGHTQTSARSVSLSLNSTSAVSMQLRNEDTQTWSSVEDMAANRSWELSAGDGVKTVFVKFIDGASNETFVQDSITLDTEPPVFNSMLINDGAELSYQRVVTVRLVASGVRWMSFSTDGSTWSPWENYADSKDLGLFAQGQESSNEDLSRSVFVRLRDYAGNVVERSDSIIFDATTLLRFTLVSVWALDCGDTLGDGEWLWHVYGTTSYNPAEFNLDKRSSSLSIGDNDSHSINHSSDITLINGADLSWRVHMYFEEEDVTSNGNLGVVSENYPYPYATGDFSAAFDGHEGSGEVFWKIERLD